MTNSFNGTTVLLIDDEVDLLASLDFALTGNGYRCLQASDASSALKILDRTPEVDVIISDIRMPGTNGIDLLREIQARDVFKDWLTVIFLTGHADMDSAVQALRLGAFDFLYKPVQRTEFLTAVAKGAAHSLKLRTEKELWKEGQDRLAQIAGGVKELEIMLERAAVTSTQKTRETEPYHALERPHIPPTKERMLELLRIRDVRMRHFTEKLFVDPAWHMLLELMECHLNGTDVSAFSLYVASGVSIATASRRLSEMEASGLVTRRFDPSDRRRQLVTITTAAVAKLEAYLFMLDKGLS